MYHNGNIYIYIDVYIYVCIRVVVGVGGGVNRVTQPSHCFQRIQGEPWLFTDEGLTQFRGMEVPSGAPGPKRMQRLLTVKEVGGE